MKPLALSKHQAPHALAALREVALADGKIADVERELLAISAELFATKGDQGDLDAIDALDLEALADAMPDPAHRAALVQRLVVIVIDGSRAARG